jgi:hypothetical protein
MGYAFTYLVRIWVKRKSGLAMVRSHKVTPCVACQDERS